jgi:hypothetical protein
MFEEGLEGLSRFKPLLPKIGARDRAQAVHYAYTHGLAGNGERTPDPADRDARDSG